MAQIQRTANRGKVDRIIVKAQAQKVFVEFATQKRKAMEELERIYESSAAVWKERERDNKSVMFVLLWTRSWNP